MSGVTGEQLYSELCAAAAASGKSLAGFVAPLFNGNSWKIEQLRIARAPTTVTIARVRALIAGEPLPPTRNGALVQDARHMAMTRAEADAIGLPPSGRARAENALLAKAASDKARVEENRRLTELAHLQRRPGQTIADCVREMRLEARS